jgi:hypothetical protein
MKISKNFLIILSFSFLTLSAHAGSLSPVEQKIDRAKGSIYTEKMIELVKNWPPSDLPALSGEGTPLWIEAIRTDGNSNYIGLRKRVFIQASLARVSSVLEDFLNYPHVFPKVEAVEVVSRDVNHVTTSWIRSRPAFFLPKVRYIQTYAFEESEGRKIYRYQLQSGNVVNFSDGIIVVEPTHDGVFVSSYDFLEGRFGLAKLFAMGKIWRDTLECFARSDYALKVASENPDWPQERIEKETDAMIDRYPQTLDKLRYLSALEVPVLKEAGAAPARQGDRLPGSSSSNH